MEMTFTESELKLIRFALRLQYEVHKRNDFRVLALEVDELRSKINDAVIEARSMVV